MRSPSVPKSTTLVRDHKVSGFVTVSGDRHSFWAGYAAPKLPPAGFDPVGLSFITGSISAPGLAEAAEYFKDSPLLPLFVRKAPGAAPEATINLTIKHGVRAALEYAASGDIAKARAATNPDVAPHLEFVDMAGHGYAVVSAGPDAIDTEFVCIVRPIARATTPDGGPLRYRVSHRASLWRPARRRSWSSGCLKGMQSCQFDDLSWRLGSRSPTLAPCVADWPGRNLGTDGT